MKYSRSWDHDKAAYPPKLLASVKAAAAEKVGVLETAQAFLERRAGKATPRDLLKFLRKAENEEPSDADRR